MKRQKHGYLCNMRFGYFPMNRRLPRDRESKRERDRNREQEREIARERQRE